MQDGSHVGDRCDEMELRNLATFHGLAKNKSRCGYDKANRKRTWRILTRLVPIQRSVRFLGQSAEKLPSDFLILRGSPFSAKEDLLLVRP